MKNNVYIYIYNQLQLKIFEFFGVHPQYHKGNEPCTNLCYVEKYIKFDHILFHHKDRTQDNQL